MLDKTFPAGQNMKNNLGFAQEQDISKSMDVQQLSPNALIQSCLTFSGEDEDMNFLSQAMQPDKIFDLPMALLKVQKAFQNSNQNALKLKESLEFVLQREQKQQEKYQQLKQHLQQQTVEKEQEMVNLKSGFKEQLIQFSQSVTQLQQQNQSQANTIHQLKNKIENLQKENQEIREQIDIYKTKIYQSEAHKDQLQKQLHKRNMDFSDLKSQFDSLLRQEQQSSQQLEEYQKYSHKEEQRLKSLVDEKQLLLQLSQQELVCCKEENRILQEQSDKYLREMPLKHNELERQYFQIVNEKKASELKVQELKSQLQNKVDLQNDLEQKYRKAKEEQVNLEEHISLIKKEIKLQSEGSREALIKQREGFENRMKEMEEEVTKSSLGRYKAELEAKQKFLKMTKKYDEQLRELRQSLGYVLQKAGVSEIPDFLKAEGDFEAINQINVFNKELLQSLQEFDQVLHKVKDKEDGQNWKVQYEQILKAYKSELQMRRGLHNQLQELKGSIRVMCRVRPMLLHEQKALKKRSSQVVKIANQHKIIISNETKDQVFQFDRVFEQQSKQMDVSDEVQQLVNSCLDGFNVCIMAYGQTGSGKTYTMIGDDENPGLYFSSVDELFSKIHDRRKLIDYEIGVSIVEIYNEQLRDLLSKKGQQAGQIIKLRDNGDGETLSDQVVKIAKSKNQILQCLREACMNRTVGTTHYNEQSSRSHFVFTIFVTGRHKETKEISRGRLNLIDLAGSERILKSQAEGDRVKEALNINQSLTTLGKVFLSLLNKASHVPYRDSKLTHYLKDSLGGESKTMLIVQVSPSSNDYGETLSTLNFGQRVSCIEKGQIRATIESPNKYVAPSLLNKRSKSQNKIVEYEITTKSVTPQNKKIYNDNRSGQGMTMGNYNSFNYN